MANELFRVGIVQDNEGYFERAGEFLDGVAEIVKATNLKAGLAMIHSLANGKLSLDLLALDERLDEDDDDGEGGRELYKLFLDVGLEGKIPVVSISSDGKLPIKQISSRAGSLLDEIRTLQS